MPSSHSADRRNGHEYPLSFCSLIRVWVFAAGVAPNWWLWV